MKNTSWKASSELTELPFVDHQNLARVAISGARENLNAIFELVAHGTPTGVQADVLHWRTRAFFWELFSAWDLFLNWANDRFELRLSAGEPQTETIVGRYSDKKGWHEVRDILLEAKQSEWFFEISRYRDFSHRSFSRTQGPRVESGGRHSVYLPLARDGQSLLPIEEHLQRYLDHMIEVGLLIESLKRDVDQAA